MSHHYCQACLSYVELKETSCLGCQNPRPATGWTRVHANRYPWLGERFGRYRMVQYLGYGTTGEVYRAVSDETLRSYAAKVIHQHTLPKYVDFSELFIRLQREVRVLSKVRSPHVVAINDFIRNQEDGLFVLVMDLASGPTLQRLLLDQHKIAVPRAIQMAEQMLDGLGEIHDCLVVHRDLKPDNIIVDTLRSGNPFVRLLDFGVAKTEDSPSLTTGFVGTPLFASPEQIIDAEKVDQRSDIYSLGCILFNMLVGHPPFESRNSTAVMQMHLTSEIPRLPPLTGDSSIDQALQELIDRAMAKDPDDRFSSAAEMLGSPAFGIGRALAVKEWLSLISKQPHSPHSPSSKDVVARLTGAYTSVTSKKVSSRKIIRLGASVEDAIVIHNNHIRIKNMDTGWRKRKFAKKRIILYATLTASSRQICLLEVNEKIFFLNASTLEKTAQYETNIGEFLWVGAARSQENTVLIIGKQGVALVHATKGVQYEKLHTRNVRNVSTVVRVAVDGYLIFSKDRKEALSLRDSPDGTISYKVRPLEDRIINAGTVMDLSVDGHMLVAQEGVILEFDLKTHQLRTVMSAVEKRWKKAIWLASESGILALAANGNLYRTQKGDVQKCIEKNIVSISFSKDRTLAMALNSTGNVIQIRSRPELLSITDAAPVVDGTLWAINEHWKVVTAEPASMQGTNLIVTNGLSKKQIFISSCFSPRKIMWSDDNLRICLVDTDGNAWLIHPSEEILPIRPSGSRVIALSSAKNGEIIVVTGDGRVMCLVPKRGQLKTLWKVRVNPGVEICVASSVAGRVALGWRTGEVELLDLSYGELILSIPTRGNPIIDCAFGSDGHMIALMRKSSLEVYDVHVGRLSYQTKISENLSTIRFAPSGKIFLFGRFGAEVRTFVDGKVQRTIPIDAWTERN